MLSSESKMRNAHSSSAVESRSTEAEPFNNSSSALIGSVNTYDNAIDLQNRLIVTLIFVLFLCAALLAMCALPVDHTPRRN
jgi:hypothetical protein